jgi:indole-3-glycerol phosphate synthase
VISEIKKASPSKGVIRADFRPADIAASYEKAGAACLSVLTDRQFFQGAPNTCRPPAPPAPAGPAQGPGRPYQVYEARAMGADAILLIAAALSLAEMQEMEAIADSLGLGVLVEVHDGAELSGAAAAHAARRHQQPQPAHLRGQPADHPRPAAAHRRRIVVTESGILAPADVALMRANQVNAFLVGEAFMRVDDPGAGLASLFG